MNACATPERGIYDFQLETTLNRLQPRTPHLRPQPGEYAPYYDRYISLVPGNDVLAALEDQRRQMLLLLSGRTEADGDLRYAPDKWSLKEVLGHINDTERIMSYRALRISRGDATPIEGYEQDDYVRNSPFGRAVRWPT